MARGRFSRSRTAALGSGVGLFAALCALPVLFMLVLSLQSADGLSFENYRHLLTQPRQRELLLTSAVLAGGAALIGTIIGAPLGLLLARADLPAKRFLRLALIVPLVIPPYILGLAWIYFGGSAGLAARTIGRDLLSGSTYSLTGAIVVLGIGFYPLSMLATEAAARRVEARLEEAALLVALPRRVLMRITLPLIAHAVAAAALIIFVLALSEFGVPALLRVRVFTTEVFTAFAALYDFGAATALAAPIMALALVAGVGVKLMIGERLLTTRRNLAVGLPIYLGRLHASVLACLAILVAAFVALPLAVLAREAGRVERVAAAVNASSSAIASSLLLATGGAVLTAALAAVVGYAAARAERLRSLANLSFIVLFAVPSTVVGIGLIGLWNRPGLPSEVYRSPLIIVIAYIARFAPVAALILSGAVRQVPVSLEEAAQVAGADWMRTFTRIVLPNLKAGLAAALVVCFILAFGELGATVLVAPPGESTLPIRIYTLIANTPSSEVAALALVQTGVVLMPLVLFGAFARGKGGGR